jgi:hypothetical protein
MWLALGVFADQDAVGRRNRAGTDAEQGLEGGVPCLLRALPPLHTRALARRHSPFGGDRTSAYSGKIRSRGRGGLKLADRLRKLREFCRTTAPRAVPLALHTLVSTGMRHASHITRDAAMEAKSASRPGCAGDGAVLVRGVGLRLGARLFVWLTPIG